MPSCSDYSELLLDWLYGLLEPADEPEVHAHLSGCAKCQAALSEAKRQQALFSRAAQMYGSLAEFVAPGDEALQPAAETVSNALQDTATTPPVPTPAVLPMPSRWRKLRRWAPIAAAAAVLLAVLGGRAWYSAQRDDYERQSASARKQLDTLDHRVMEIAHSYADKAAKL